MNFGDALKVLKAGGRVHRQGWNGRGMHLFMARGIFDFGDKPLKRSGDLISGVSPTLFDKAAVGTMTYMPHLCMVAADGSVVRGWLASQTDMLAEDWGVAS